MTQNEVLRLYSVHKSLSSTLECLTENQYLGKNVCCNRILDELIDIEKNVFGNSEHGYFWDKDPMSFDLFYSLHLKSKNNEII